MGDQLVRLHSRRRQGLDHPGIHAFEDLHQGADPIGLGVGQGPRVAGVQGDKAFASLFQRDVGDHLRVAKLVLLGADACLRVHLGLSDRALFLFDGDFGVEFALANGALLLDGEVAASEDRFVGILEDRLARFRFQRLRRVGRWLDAPDGYPEDLETQ
jgi:hypothetical protein